MNWHPIDFQGIVGLDYSVVDQIERYLQEKETRLAHQTLNSLPETLAESQAPTLPISPGVHLKLSDAVEGLTKKIRALGATAFKQAADSQDTAARVIKDLNASLWEFTEVLEGCVIELFQQIKQVNLDKWHVSLAKVVHLIKEILLHRIEDLIWVVRRLEGLLSEYRQKMGATSQGWRSWVGSKPKQIDPNILVHLNQSEQYLKSQYTAFYGYYQNYVRLNTQVEDYFERMKSYPILAIMSTEDQNLYVDIFRLLKLWELNSNPKGTLALETRRSIKHLCSIDGALDIFRVYYYELRDAFFNSSLELKTIAEQFQDKIERTQRLQTKVKDYHHELQHLVATISKYREFVLQTDTNPYVRSRWGFTERTVAPEPAKVRDLLHLIYAAEGLIAWYETFLNSLTGDPLQQERKENQAHEEIDRLLHEMGQPLISRSMMHNRAGVLLGYISECEEIGSPHFSTIEYIQDVFSKAMRADWKYHVLHEFPVFHDLYQIHKGLQKPIKDPAHAFRVDRFHQLFEKIEEWVNREDIYSHVHEIEIDMSDMKTYLQDFLAMIQRSARDKSSDPFLDETIDNFRQQLLDYRYIFGQFFFHIMHKNLDGQQLRNQFLFVDQYFESIENLLNDLKVKWEGKERDR